MARTLYIVTGGLAIIGGIATALISSSCDIPCVEAPAHSVVAQFYRKHGPEVDTLVTMDTVQYRVFDTNANGSLDDLTQRPPLEHAVCLDEACTVYGMGIERDGRFEIEATYCGKTYRTSAQVELQENSCVETQYVAVEVGPCPAPPGLPVDGPPPSCDDDGPFPVIVMPTRSTEDGDVAAGVPYLSYRPKIISIQEEGSESSTGLDAWKTAQCIGEKIDQGCSAWLVELPGPSVIDVASEYCDVRFHDVLDLSQPTGRCPIDPPMVMLDVDTRGCLRTAPPPKPGPVGPRDLRIPPAPPPPPTTPR